ncbi:MAG: hypothetical protein HKN26_11420, partial [Acidimicrobiales bacterium]|nr:hypothetical protein [Acidimicrobiales bacterium]
MLGTFVGELRSMGQGDGVMPDQALTEFVSAPHRQPETVALTTTHEKEHPSMLSQLATIAATTAGKVALTGGVAAAAVTGVVVVDNVTGPEPVVVVASDGSDDSSTTSTLALSERSTTTMVKSSESSSSSTPVGSPIADTEPITIQALEAGTVTYQVSDGSIVLLEAAPAAGWIVKAEADRPGEVELSFRNGDQRIDVDIEIDDGEVKVEVERKDGDSSDDEESYGDHDYEDDSYNDDDDEYD